jgi:DNA repair protein RecN (Recombination protein N)
MLTSLDIQNIALVESASLSFAKGLTVLTGETGAGKSIIVTALSLVLGGRSEKEYVRHGADKASVTATFNVIQMPSAWRKQFAEAIFDGTMTVTREITRDGGSRVKINGELSSLIRLKEITSSLAQILGQHANQMLMHEENHLLFLDRFAGLESLREQTSELFTQWEKAVTELRRTTGKRDQLMRERELLIYQKSEIEKGNVRVGEEEELLRERRILDSSRTLMASADTIEHILSTEEASVLTQLRFVRKELEKMAAVDSTLEKQAEELADIDFRLEDLRRFVEQYGASIPDDPSRLEIINLRLDELYALKKKFGGSEESILGALREIEQNLQNRPDTDNLIAELERESNRLGKEYAARATELSALRKKAADYLKKLVIKELTELAIDDAGFELELIYQDDPDGVLIDGKAVQPCPYGLETARILFSANKGEPLKSLVRTASGGEISRVLLALKAAEKKNADIQQSLLVFDEVDAGIGGRTANEVAKKLKKLSESCQLLVVTHLHQIARLADSHLVAEKTRSKSGRSTIQVRSLDRTGVKAELARMVALPD